MIEGLNIVISQTQLVNSVIGAITFLVVSCGTLIAVLIKILYTQMTKKIEKCNQDCTTRIDTKNFAHEQKIKLMEEYNKETRKSVYHAHDRLTEHVEKHHTKG